MRIISGAVRRIPLWIISLIVIFSSACTDRDTIRTFAESVQSETESVSGSAGSTEALPAMSATEEEPFVHRGAWVIGCEGYDPDKPPGYDDSPGQPGISIQPLSGPAVVMEGAEGRVQCMGFEGEPVPTEYPIGQYIDYRYYWESEPEDLIRFTEVWSLGAKFTAGEVDRDTEATIRLYIDSPEHIVSSVEYTLMIRNNTVMHEWEVSWAANGVSCTPECDRYGNVYLFGTFGNDTDFDPGPGVAEYSPLRDSIPDTYPSNQDDTTSFFLSKFDRNGSFQWVRVFGKAWRGYQRFRADIEIDDAGLIYLLGNFEGIIDLDPGPGTEMHEAPEYSMGAFLSAFNLNGEFQWARVWGENRTDPFTTRCLEVDSSGNVYVAGTFSETVNLGLDGEIMLARSPNWTAICLYKFDSTGRFDWVRTIGEKAEGQYAYMGSNTRHGVELTDLDTDASGNILLTGTFTDTCDLDPGPEVVARTSAGTEDVFLSALDPSGGLLWCRTFGAEEDDTVASMVIKDGSEILLTGLFKGTVDFGDGSSASIASAYDQSTEQTEDSETPQYREFLKGSTFLASYDTDGSFRWVKIWDTPQVSFSRWDQSWINRDVSVDSAGDILVVGPFYYKTDFDPGAGVYEVDPSTSADIYLSRFNGSGEFKSVDVWGIEGSVSECHFAVDDYGSAFLVEGSGNLKFIRKYLSPDAGEVEIPEEPRVAAEFVGPPAPPPVEEIPYTEEFGEDTGWVVTWAPRSSVWPSSLYMDPSGPVYICGSYTIGQSYQPGLGFEDCSGYGMGDCFLMKIGADSEILWTRCWGGPDSSSCTDLRMSDDGNLIVLGRFRGEVDFDPGPGVETRNENRSQFEIHDPNFASVFDTDGNFISVEASIDGPIASFPQGELRQLPQFPNGRIWAISLDYEGDVYLAGSFSETATFGWMEEVVQLTPHGRNDIFIAKYSDGNSLQWAKTFGGMYDWSEVTLSAAKIDHGLLFISGTFDSPVDFDPGPGEEILESYGFKRGFIAAYDLNGDYVGGFAFGERGPQYNGATDMAFDPTGAIYLIGRFNGRTDFCPGDEVYYVEAGRNSGSFLLKILADGTW